MKYEKFEFDQFDLWPYLLINDKLIGILYSIYGISNGCYFGGIEVWRTLLDYDSSWKDPSKIATSFAQNFGFIYTLVRDLWSWTRNDARTPIKTSYDMGLALGQLYYFLLIS